MQDVRLTKDEAELILSFLTNESISFAPSKIRTVVSLEDKLREALNKP